jgi:molybdopterin-binding protein
MSKILAKIEKIKSVDSLNIVTFDFFGKKLTMMSLELSDQIQEGKKVLLGVKPTSIVLAKDFSGLISFSNHLEGKIVSFEIGELLATIKIEIANSIFESIITKNTALKMDLKIDEKISVFIKASEISIVEIIDE